MDYADIFANLFSPVGPPDPEAEEKEEEDANGSIQICEEHRQYAITSLEQRGLASLISDNQNENESRLRGMMEDGPSLDNFEPLVYIQLLIFEGSIQLAGGLFAFLEAHGCEVCPICFLNDVHDNYAPGNCDTFSDSDHTFDRWITLAADAALETWKEFND